MKVLTHHLTNAINPIDEKQDFLSFCQGNEIIFHSENCFSVKNKENLYLTAFRDGSIRFHSQKCDSWEKFYILDNEAEEVINFAVNQLKVDYKFFLNHNKVHLLIGNEVITPSFIPPAGLKQGKWFVEYQTLTEKKRLQVNKPLIYFCIYGKEEYYECFYLSVKSLIEKGKYKGDILVKTDNIDKVKEFSEQFENHFIFSQIDRNLGIFNRYWLHESCLKEYSSLIYLDADILVINEINDLLKIFQKNDLMAYLDREDGDITSAKRFFYENEPYKTYKWYGFQYVNKEYVRKNDTFYMFNSGFFVINNLAKVKPVMDKVVQYRAFEDSQGDQPFFNLALYNSDIDIKTLNYTDNLAFSRSNYQSFRNLDKVLIHYNSGVGNVSKLNLMKETWEYINK